jgi:hypothetical protein
MNSISLPGHRAAIACRAAPLAIFSRE